MSHLWKKKTLWDNVMEDLFEYFDEKEGKTVWRATMVLSHGETTCTVRKIFITIILNFNAFTINLQKQFIECLGKTQGKGKNNAFPSPTNHLKSSWSAPPPCGPQPLSYGLENIFYLWLRVPPNHFPVDWKIAFIYEYLCISIYVKYQGAMEFLTSYGIFSLLNFLRI